MKPIYIMVLEERVVPEGYKSMQDKMKYMALPDQHRPYLAPQKDEVRLCPLCVPESWL